MINAIKRPGILLYSRDLKLSQLRARMLEAAGNEVSFTINLDMPWTILDSDTINLVVLCNTLETKHCREMVADIMAFHPFVKVLILHDGSSSCSKGTDAAMFDITEGTDAFLRTIDKLVATTNN